MSGTPQQRRALELALARLDSPAQGPTLGLSATVADPEHALGVLSAPSVAGADPGPPAPCPR